MEEVWRDIPGYEGKYQASSIGEIRSLNYMRTGKVRILKKVIDRHGYYQTILCKNGKTKTITVHRLVALSFPEICGEWFEGAQVNHKDENKLNNCVYNLEWCDCKYNINYGTGNAKRIDNRKGKTAPKDVFQIKDNKIINHFKSITEASIFVRGEAKYSTQISAACKGKQKTAFGYKWQYV